MPFNPCPALKPLFLDKSLTRAQEYTANRTAVYYAEEGALDLSDHPVGYRRMQALKEAKEIIYRANVNCCSICCSDGSADVG